MSSSIEQAGTAAKSVGAPIAQAGDWGVMVYALILIVFLLIVRDWLKDRSYQQLINKMASALEKSAAADAGLAQSVATFASTMARVEFYLAMKEED